MRPPISFADALHAAWTLKPDAEARIFLLSTLGLSEPAESDVRPAALGVWKASSNEAVGRAAPPPPLTIAVPDEAPTPPTPRRSLAGGPQTVATLQESRTDAPPAPLWLSIPGHSLADDSDEEGDMRPDPLFSDRTGRAIVSTALATLVSDGEIDVDRVIEVLGAGQPLYALPRQPIPTLRHGAQVLVDLGTSMDPYRQDVEAMLTRFDAVLSTGRLSVLGFLGCPSRGTGIGPQAEWRPWTPPAPDIPIVVVSDLGIGGPVMHTDHATPGEWGAFARTVRASRRPLLAFVPYEARRWPPRLSRLMTIIHWSERTKVGAVRRAVREALRARRD